MLTPNAYTKTVFGGTVFQTKDIALVDRLFPSLSLSLVIKCNKLMLFNTKSIISPDSFAFLFNTNDVIFYVYSFQWRTLIELSGIMKTNEGRKKKKNSNETENERLSPPLSHSTIVTKYVNYVRTIWCQSRQLIN